MRDTLAGWSRPARRAIGTTAVGLALVAGTVGAPSPASGAPGDVGQESQAYVESKFSTVAMPESKLWYHDGTWWAAMLQTGEPSTGGAENADVTVFKRVGSEWVSTGTEIDVRGTTKQDVVASGNTLYVASHKKLDNETLVEETNTSNFTRLTKLTYNPTTKTYSVVSGFPVVMNKYQMEALTIDVDSSGVVWAGWVQADKVMWQRSTDGGATWSTPTALTVSHAVTTDDDLAGLVAYGNRVGIMWSSQVAGSDGYWFSSTAAGSGAPAWTAAEGAYTGVGRGDDHVSIKAVGDQLVAAVKTRSGTPGVVALRRSATGTWSATTAWNSSTDATRPVIASDGDKIYVFATLDVDDGSEGIYAKTASLASPSFSAGSIGTAVMSRPLTGNINDVTTTKQVVSSTSGLVAVASDTTTLRYWTHTQSIAPVVVPPSAPASATAVPRPGKVAVTWTAATPGSSAITGYRITATPALAANIDLPVSATGTPQLVTVPNGVARTFHVQALAGATVGPVRSTATVTPSNHVPFASADAFAAQQAADFLGRPLTATELATVRTALASQTGAAVVAGPTFMGDAGVAGATYRGRQAQVVRLYVAYFLRAADTNGFDYWMGRLDGGLTLERISQMFAASGEFKTRYGSLTDRQFITLVYQNLFQRTPSDNEVDYWQGRLEGGVQRGRMMTYFSESGENINRTRTLVTVSLAYRWMLDRMPTTAQLGVELAKPSAEASIQDILLSAAYQARISG